MSEPSKRNRQVADMIQRELSLALRREIKDPRLANLSITDVVLSPDFKHAKIYFNLINDKDLEDAKIALQRGTGHFRHILAEKLALRFTPALVFYYDQTLLKAERLGKLLSETEKKIDETEE